MQLHRLALLLIAGFLLAGCGYNSIQSKDEGVKAAWSEVLNQYQRRADLVPNLVNTVKGYADALFQTLQAQLEGTENRIAVARNRYIAAIQDYNTFVRSFPQNITAMMFGYKAKANFTVENEKAIATPPTVDFNKPAQPAANPPPQPQPAD